MMALVTMLDVAASIYDADMALFHCLCKADVNVVDRLGRDGGWTMEADGFL